MRLLYLGVCFLFKPPSGNCVVTRHVIIPQNPNGKITTRMAKLNLSECHFPQPRRQEV